MRPRKGDILAKIMTAKAEEVIAAQVARPFAAVDAEARITPPPRGFCAALRQKIAAGKPAVIAEIKKASPSKGLLREDVRSRGASRRRTSAPARPACRC